MTFESRMVFFFVVVTGAGTVITFPGKVVTFPPLVTVDPGRVTVVAPEARNESALAADILLFELNPFAKNTMSAQYR